MKKIILYIILTFSFLISLSSQTWDLYSVDNSNIISNNINSIDVDKYDNILIATSEGISIFKNGEWKNIKKEEIVNSGSISRIKAYDTTIYISQGETNGIYQSQNDYWKLLLDDKNATTLEVVNQDFLLFANRDYLYSYKNNILTQLDTVKFISDILFRKNGDIWFSAINDSYGLYELGKGKINLGENYKFSQILSIVEDKINNVWIATSANTSIQRFDVSNNTWDIYDRESLPINESSTLINVQCDSNNNIWVLGIFGSNAGDQFLLKKTINGWEKFDFSELFEKGGEFNFLLPNSMCIDSKNNVWIGTNQGLIKFNEA